MEGPKWYRSTPKAVSLSNAPPVPWGLLARDPDGMAVVRWGSRVRVNGSSEIREVAGHGNCFGRIVRLGRFSVITLSETHHSLDSSVGMHRHKFPGFFMPLQGTFEVAIGEDKFRLGNGRACYYSAEDAHSSRAVSGSASALNVEVRCGSTDAFAPSRHRITRPGSRIPMILMQMHHELRLQDAASMQAVQGLALQATAELIRDKTADRCEPPLWLKEAAQFIAANVAERIDMKALTSVAGTGTRDLFRAFKKFFNRTPAEYLREQRIAVARQLLAETTVPIARVASDVGFYDQAHFCHEFKKATGCSPREYREVVGLREPAACATPAPREVLAAR